MNPMHPRHRAVFFALVAVVFWSTSATAFSFGLREMDGLQLMLGAVLVSVVCLVFLAILQGKGSCLRAVGFSELKHAALLGFLNPFLYYAILLKAYSILPAQEAMALKYLWPVVLVLLSIRLPGQRVTKGEWIALGISFFGILIIATQGNLSQLKLTNGVGDALALGSSLIWALYWIVNVRTAADDIVKLILNLAFGSVYLLVAVLLFSELEIPSKRGAGAMLYIGLFEIAFAFFFWLKALRLSKSTAQVGQLIFLAPFLSLFWIQLALKESIQPVTLIGLLIVIGGILLQQYLARSNTPEKNVPV